MKFNYASIFLIWFFLFQTSYSISIGTPLSATSKKVLLCGGGELGKELVIELQRFGVEVIVVDSYHSSPAMQVAHRSHVISMLDGDALRSIIEKEKPDIIVPEIEAIATEVLLEFEDRGYKVIPNARAVHTTMNRERIRRLAAEELKLKTSKYQFAQSYEEYLSAVDSIGLPCVVKPIMSSSGKGQSIVKTKEEIKSAWDYAQSGGRAKNKKVIVEEFINFDFEVTILTVRENNGNVSFCAPIGHKQIDGDYRESWQPQSMNENAYAKALLISKTIVNALGGSGIFGVELFVAGEEVFFSEVSPRPHDTGMVTLISQNLSEFALHARAILGLPIPSIIQYGPAASCALLVFGDSNQVTFSNLDEALEQANTQLRLFGKPNVSGHRRMGVTLALGETVQQACDKAKNVLEKIEITF